MAVQVLEGIGRERAGVSGKMGQGLQEPQRQGNGGYLERGMMMFDDRDAVCRCFICNNTVEPDNDVETLKIHFDLDHGTMTFYSCRNCAKSSMMNRIGEKFWKLTREELEKRDNCEKSENRNHEGELE